MEITETRRKIAVYDLFCLVFVTVGKSFKFVPSYQLGRFIANSYRYLVNAERRKLNDATQVLVLRLSSRNIGQ